MITALRRGLPGDKAASRTTIIRRAQTSVLANPLFRDQRAPNGRGDRRTPPFRSAEKKDLRLALQLGED